MRRYKITKLLVLVFPLLYLLVVAATEYWRHPQERLEVFPFFNWKLFVHTPHWVKDTPALIVHSADGNADGDRWVIPSRSTNDMKVLNKVWFVCEHRAPDDCLREVERHLLPIVADFLGGEEGRGVEFSLVWASADLRDIQDDIWDLYEGRTRRVDYLAVDRVASRWRSGGGELTRVDGAGP